MSSGHAEDTRPPWRRRLHTIIFEADTPAGLAFDEALLLAIVLSVAVVVLASIDSVMSAWGPWLIAAEWLFTVLFTVEYALRLLAVSKPAAYARSFFGVVDLLSVIPTWLGLFIAGAESLLVVRLLRMVRIFRVFKLANHLQEGRLIVAALQRSARKITVFMTAVLALITILGAMMYVVEGPAYGFTSIPIGMYWAAVTITTVGYGDISPGTPLGRVVAMAAMLTGYAILAVPTGIVSVEIARGEREREVTTQACPACGCEGHGTDARYCYACGAALHADG